MENDQDSSAEDHENTRLRLIINLKGLQMKNYWTEQSKNQ